LRRYFPAVVGVLANNPGGVGAKTFLNPIVDEYSRMTDREMVSSVCCWRGTPSTAGRKRRRGGSQDSCCGWSGELGIVAVSGTAVGSVVERAAAEIHAVPTLWRWTFFIRLKDPSAAERAFSINSSSSVFIVRFGLTRWDYQLTNGSCSTNLFKKSEFTR